MSSKTPTTIIQGDTLSQRLHTYGKKRYHSQSEWYFYRLYSTIESDGEVILSHTPTSSTSSSLDYHNITHRKF